MPADLITPIEGANTPIYLGENTTEAARQAALATAAMDVVEAAGYTVIEAVWCASHPDDGNVTLSGSQTVGGETPANGKRVGIFGQTDGAENGIWIVNTSGAWTRATDFNESAEVVTGALVPVLYGTNAGSFVLVTTGTITVGITAQTWRMRDARAAAKVTLAAGGSVQDFVTAIEGSTGAALVGATTGDTVQDRIDALNGTGPVLIAIAGQSNAVGVYDDGPNPSDSRVNTWNPSTSEWVSGGQYTAAPWTSVNPTGNSSKNNFALAAAHRIAQETGRDVYIVFDALSGQSITEWVPDSATRYAALKTKIENALASPELVAAGKTEIDFLIWAQGEEDFEQTFDWYYDNLIAFDKQLRAETWMSEYTPVYTMGINRLGDRYPPAAALKSFCYNSIGEQSPQYPNTWVYISNRSLRTEWLQNLIDTGTGSGDNSHWLGIWVWHAGYNLIAPAWLNSYRANQDTSDTLFWGRSTGPATAGDSKVVAAFDTLVNWSSRSGGVLTQSFDGDGSTTAFTLDYYGATSYKVTVGGVEMATPADYSISGQTLTFVSAPASGAGNIVVTYGSAILGSAATSSLGWGYACWPGGNYTFAGGYKTVLPSGVNYSFGWGRDIVMASPARYCGAFGYQNNLENTYQFAAGRGHTLVDSGMAAVGTFSAYTTTQTDPVMFQVGVGTTSGSRANGLTVRKSGVWEQKTTTVAALPAAGTAGRRAFVTDANATTFASIVAGGGSNGVPVYDDGTNWRIG